MSEKGKKAATGSTTSGQAIANNVDLLAQILLLLPAKSLIRFKSVSKHWRSLISHPQFASTHCLRNPSPPSISGLYFYSNDRLNSVSLYRNNRNLPSLSFLPGLEGKYFKTTIQHSCNGLLLLSYFFGPTNVFTLFIVCNPTTHGYNKLPKARLSSRSAVFYHSPFLIFDPSKSPHYKVVVVSRYKFESFEIDVYNSETRNWKNINIDFDFWDGGDLFLWGIPCHAAFWNGAIHWLSYTGSHSLLKFDVDAEKMIMLPFAPMPTMVLPLLNNIRYFGECGGSLILILSDLPSTEELRILELEGDNSRWIVKYRVDLRTSASAFLEIENDFKYFVLCVMEGKEKEDYSLVLAIPGKVISYNLKCKTLDVLRDLVPGELIDHGINGLAYPFVETLSLV